MPAPAESLKRKLDNDYPTFGTWGAAALLDAITKINLGYTVDTGSGILTTATPHGLVTGTRVRMTATGVQPGILPTGNLSGSIDYFIHVLGVDEITLHNTLADAIASTNPIQFSDGGTGSLELNEQALTVEDPITVLINHELDHPDYFRLDISSLPVAFIAGGEARKNTNLWTVTANTPNGAIVFGSVLTIQNGTTTIGSTSGDVDFLDIRSTPVTIAAGQSKSYAIQFAAANA
jgi:hypothetical protein